MKVSFWVIGCLLVNASYSQSMTEPANAKGAEVLKHTTILSSDVYEGRAPGSKGEELTIKYLTDQFKTLGLKPGNTDGSFVQQVPLYGYRSSGTAELLIKGKKIPLAFPDNYVAVSRKYSKDISVNQSQLVFVGYGIDAPEYGWDDYKGVDVKGKTIVMLVNDPLIRDSKDTSKLDEQMFKGKAMTYYGRWTYKYEEASRKGAAAAIIIHETGPAGYPFEVVTGSWGHENFDIRSNATSERIKVESWISLEKAKELFREAGLDFATLKKSAMQKDFKPVSLDGHISFSLTNSLRDIKSKNVLAKTVGTDPVLKDEYVIYTAHWDHLGRDTSLKGDQIYNGAFDNASGVAGLLELARLFSKTKTKRSLLFMAVTAEEEGLLGTKFYAENPVYPLSKTLANVNMDGINPLGKTKDIIVVGKGQSELEQILHKQASAQGRVTAPEDTPEKGFYYRSDHFEFAKKGVPALYTEVGKNFVGQPGSYGEQVSEAYLNNDYHKVSDEVKPGWTFEGGAQDLDLLYEVGKEIADGPEFPKWLQTSEFKAVREKMLKK